MWKEDVLGYLYENFFMNTTKATAKNTITDGRTLEEIAMEAREIFLEHGGKDYRYIPCLNNNSKWIDAMYDIAQVHLSGWSLGVESDAILAERDRLAELAKVNIS